MRFAHSLEYTALGSELVAEDLRCPFHLETVVLRAVVDPAAFKGSTSHRGRQLQSPLRDDLPAGEVSR